MERLRMWVGACALAILALGAAPPSRPDEDPEPPKVVYHHYNVIINGKKRSPDELRKLFAPLALARCEEFTDDELAIITAKGGREWRHYGVWIRSRDGYGKVQAVIKDKPGVHRVWPPHRLIPKTTDRLPVPIVRKSDPEGQHGGYVPVQK